MKGRQRIKVVIRAFYLILFLIALLGCVPVNDVSQAPTGAVASETTQATGQLLMHVLDVGQGQAILFQFPNGKTMLYDGGRSKSRLETRLDELGITNVDVIVASNLDADHVAGLIGAFEKYNVEMYIDPGVSCNTKTCSSLGAMAEAEGSQYVQARAGMTLNIDSSIRIEVLNPQDPPIANNDNDNSVVLKITTGNNKVLLMGDCEYFCEQVLLETGVDIDADILQVGHHGSRTSTSDDLLEQVTPNIATISVGAGNQYGHPHPEIISKLENAGIQVRRTDLEGAFSLSIK